MSRFKDRKVWQFDNACEVGKLQAALPGKSDPRPIVVQTHVMSCHAPEKNKSPERKKATQGQKEALSFPHPLARPAFRFQITYPPAFRPIELVPYVGPPRLRPGYIIRHTVASDLVLINSKILRVSESSHVEHRFDSNDYTGMRGEKPSCRTVRPHRKPRIFAPHTKPAILHPTGEYLHSNPIRHITPLFLPSIMIVTVILHIQISNCFQNA